MAPHYQEKEMAKVFYIGAGGERQVHESETLLECVAEAIRLNAEKGFTAGVHVVERDDGRRMSHNECLKFQATA